jgi:hypothetical protein
MCVTFFYKEAFCCDAVFKRERFCFLLENLSETTFRGLWKGSFREVHYQGTSPKYFVAVLLKLHSNSGIKAPILAPRNFRRQFKGTV